MEKKPRGKGKPNPNMNIKDFAKPREKKYTEEEVEKIIRDYHKEVCDSIRDFSCIPLVMLESDLAERMDVDEKTKYNYLTNYFPHLKKLFEQLRADSLALGAMLGRYQSSYSIFAAKNWCGWTDKQEVKNDIALHNSLEDFLDELDG